jgi:hypothetical protein
MADQLCFGQFGFSGNARIGLLQILHAIFELTMVLWKPPKYVGDLIA